MQAFESLMSGAETLSETNGETREFVGPTEVCGFENCELMSNEQLGNYLSETIPPSHLEGCPSIEFDPQNYEFMNDPQTLGFYECGSHAIHIADETRFTEGAEEIIETVIHEVGHNAYAEIIETNPILEAQWEGLNAGSYLQFLVDGTGFVSDYARTNQYEDFAESYMTYIGDPEKLQMLSPDKYEFMYDHVFAGREYAPAILADWV